MNYELVIGMETHIELDTESKMFCGCSAKFFGAEPNINVCPTCLGQPGALPVINKRAVEFTMMLGLALNCKINQSTFWERKSYWYPDLPKGYQVTQYQYPTAYDGYIDIDVRDLSQGWNEQSYRKRIRIRRAHLEEDTGKLTHIGKNSAVDYNRSGVPLVEIVTEPDINTPDEAYAYLMALRDIVRYLGISTGDMEKGAMRCEPNISLRPAGSETFGTKVEIQNLNSFRVVRDSVAYEFKRQADALDRGEKVRQVTLGWDDVRSVTVVQREKEDAHDYRYFPEPDLPPLDVSDAWLDDVRTRVPELPIQRQQRYQQSYGLSGYDAAQLTSERAISDYFDRAVNGNVARAKGVANFISGELFRMMKAQDMSINEVKVQPAQLSELVGLVENQTINSNTAKQVLEEMFASGTSAQSIIDAKGLAQVSDTAALQKIVDEIIAANPQQVARYRGGDEKLFGFFVGQAMKALKGKGNPQVINQLLREQLDVKQ
jgi:aspartyl-tRNA(Asn)/glutamyl-tRNA(Gln) amidotransferase subunit B